MVRALTIHYCHHQHLDVDMLHQWQTTQSLPSVSELDDCVIPKYEQPALTSVTQHQLADYNEMIFNVITTPVEVNHVTIG